MGMTTTMARVKQRVDALRVSMKLPAKAIAGLADLSPMKFSNALAGNIYLGSEVEMQLSELTLLLQDLELVVQPLVLPTDETTLRNLLDFVKEHNVNKEDVRSAFDLFFGVVQ
jgi:hypothetical protein